MARKPSRACWRRAWVEGSRDWSAEAQAIAASSPLEDVGPQILELALAGRLHPPAEEEDDIVGRLFARARELDPEAWAERDRLEAERGVNPDRLDQRPRNAAEHEMRERRSYSMGLAVDEHICGGRPEIAAALRTLDPVTAH